MLTEGDYFVHVIDFGCGAIGGAVRPNEDGTYSVYINARLSRQEQIKALDHELRHIERGDLYNNIGITLVELRR